MGMVRGDIRPRTTPSRANRIATTIICIYPLFACGRCDGRGRWLSRAGGWCRCGRRARFVSGRRLRWIHHVDVNEVARVVVDVAVAGDRLQCGELFMEARELFGREHAAKVNLPAAFGNEGEV